ncbi:MAG: hypothetical protein JSV77_00405 [Dehalococcoidales bacterium]|nr:MAG: hypothetical protein JSV77_00405 [Dehalococcoidales bacterium]
MTTIGEQILINIDEKKVLRDVGYDANRRPPTRVTALARDYAENVNQLVNPAFSYVIKDIDFVVNSSVFIEGGFVFQSQVISELLKMCEKVAVFALTIDGYLEETVAQLAENGLIVQARVLDAIGSNAVEQVADHVQDIVKDRVSTQGFHISRRYSPGYCDWEVDQQQTLFRAMNGSNISIQLTDKNLMLPRKSISGIIGIGTCKSEIENYNPCVSCQQHDCPGRR